MKKTLLTFIAIAGLVFAEVGSFTGESYRTEVNVGYAPSYVKVIEINGTNPNVYEYVKYGSLFTTVLNTGSTGVLTKVENITVGSSTDEDNSIFYGFEMNTTIGNTYIFQTIR